jgi:hypothetical protein
MASSIISLKDQAPVVVLRAFVAGLLIVVVFAIVAADEQQPHIELAPLPVSLAIPAVPVASGGIAPEDPAWRM